MAEWEPWAFLLALTGFKLLLLPAYRSTDFEVHRNWMAITSSRPLSQWYLDETSEWTLDYPPLFAWFEWVLSLAARLVDPAMLMVENLNYASFGTIAFQRMSVIVTDGVLVAGVWMWCRPLPTERRLAVWVLTLGSPGLLMVDHVHFQYNGLLMGLLILSVALVRDGRDLVGGLVYAALLMMKHLFAYAAPVYFIYLLRHHCRGPRAVNNFLALGGGVVAVVAAAMGPFVALGQLPQVLARLFPFGRGLCHAYWAPNWWALYSAADKVLATAARLAGRGGWVREGGNMASGLVGGGAHLVLPQVTPPMTLVMVLAAVQPCLFSLWERPRPEAFPRAVAFAFLCGYMFGWHVHEKALLHVTLPLTLLATERWGDACDAVFLSTVCHVSLLPLLFKPGEQGLKLLLVNLYTPAALLILRGLAGPPGRGRGTATGAGRGGGGGGGQGGGPSADPRPPGPLVPPRAAPGGAVRDCGAPSGAGGAAAVPAAHGHVGVLRAGGDGPVGAAHPPVALRGALGPLQAVICSMSERGARGDI